MLPLFDMFTRAQQGEAADLVARQFGISADKAREAMAAFAPAFSEALKRNTADGQGLASFLDALASGRHAAYFEDASRAFQPSGLAEGNGILGHLFGSKELSRTLAAQAAQATGLAEDTLKKMLPGLAAIMMGGLFKQTNGELGQTGSGNPMQDFFRQMADMAGGAPAGGAGNPFQAMMDAMTRGGAAMPAAGTGLSGNPFLDAFRQMSEAGEAARERDRKDTKRGAYDSFFAGMFDAGTRQRDEYEKTIKAIFDGLAGDKKARS